MLQSYHEHGISTPECLLTEVKPAVAVAMRQLRVLTHCGSGVRIAASITTSILARALLVPATIRQTVQWRVYEFTS
jgi:hypothetical protein